MAKPKPTQVPSDDCVVLDGDERLNPHEGEWVLAYCGYRAGDARMMRGLQELKAKMAAIEGDDDAGQQQMILTSDAFGEVIIALQDRIVAWNWTDDRGRPYPQPEEDPNVFHRLRIDEAIYLGMVVQKNNPKAEQVFTKPLPIAS